MSFTDVYASELLLFWYTLNTEFQDEATLFEVSMKTSQWQWYETLEWLFYEHFNLYLPYNSLQDSFEEAVVSLHGLLWSYSRLVVWKSSKYLVVNHI